ncbi:hypothetical protein TNCV_4937341 [Trichonephila clavipes]|nr:hypothetical protein TNCV_4937341 [Trichonephila clavipes]
MRSLNSEKYGDTLTLPTEGISPHPVKGDSYKISGRQGTISKAMNNSWPPISLSLCIGGGHHMYPVDINSKILIFRRIQPEITFDCRKYTNQDFSKAESKKRRGPAPGLSLLMLLDILVVYFNTRLPKEVILTAF